MELDTVIRLIAKNGKFDGTANWHNSFNRKTFSCTEGAGQNGAYVYNEYYKTLYKVINYGQNAIEIHIGPWVKFATEEAERIEKVNQLLEKLEQDRKEKEKLQRFAPCED